MRILFSSDLHALKPAFELFAATLAEGPYEAGVLAGDLLDDMWLPDEILMRLTGASADDILEELPEADDPAPWKTAVASRGMINDRGLACMERALAEILGASGKPVLMIPGNHDLTRWEDRGSVVNIDGRRLELGGWAFVGYRWTSLERSEAEQDADFRALGGLVDRHSVLVTHEAPYGQHGSGWDGKPLGSAALSHFLRARRPRWHLYGHIHSGFGARGRSVNGCYPNARSFFDLDLDAGSARPVPAEVSPTAKVIWA